MPYDDDGCEEIYEDIVFLYNLIRRNTNDGHLKMDLSNLNDMIEKKIPDILNRISVNIWKELYQELKIQYEIFQNCVCYKELRSKRIVALGGNCPKSKSVFLQNFMEKGNLITETVKKLNMPVYVMHGNRMGIQGMNVLDQIVSMDMQDFKKAVDVFGKIGMENRYIFRNILKNIGFTVPFLRCENLAFLHVPICSASDCASRFQKMDREEVRRQLNSCSMVCWFIQADHLEEFKEHIEYLQEIRDHVPKVIIVDRGNVESLAELMDILERIRFYLNAKGISYLDVTAFSDHPEKIMEQGLRDFVKGEMQRLKEQVQSWDYKKPEKDIFKGFAGFFAKIQSVLQEKVHEEMYKLQQLNDSLLNLSVQQIDRKILYPFHRVTREMEKKIRMMNQDLAEVKELEKTFFVEIKKICEAMGMDLSGFSEMDLFWQQSVSDPIALIREYKKKAGVKTDYYIAEILESIFENTEPVMRKYPGGSDYGEEILQVLKTAGMINPKDIEMTDINIMNKVPKFVDIMKQI